MTTTAGSFDIQQGGRSKISRFIAKNHERLYKFAWLDLSAINLFDFSIKFYGYALMHEEYEF